MDLRTRPDVLRFVTCARSFCDLLEVDPEDHAVWLAWVLRALAEIYTAAHDLTVTGLDLAPDFSEGSFDPTPEELRQVRARVGRVLGNDNLYWCQLDLRISPGANAPQPGVGDLTDDLTDIYRDLIPGLRAWDEGTDEYLADIVFGWKEPLFASHWGLHAVDALPVLHSLVYNSGSR